MASCNAFVCRLLYLCCASLQLAGLYTWWDSAFSTRNLGDHEHAYIQLTFRNYRAVTTDSKGQIIVTEWNGHQVSIFSPEWDKILSLGSGSRSSREGQFKYPAGVTVDDDDNIYVVDSNNHRIQKFSSDGNFVCSVGTYSNSHTAC